MHTPEDMQKLFDAHPDAYTFAVDEDAVAQDAVMYAADQGVDLDEAIRRLQLQDPIGELDAELTENERDTFGGLLIQHAPEFRVVVRFTRGAARR